MKMSGSPRRNGGSFGSERWLTFVGLVAHSRRSGGSKCVGISRAEISFNYSLDFVKIGSGVSIVIPSFSGVAFSPSEIATKVDGINDFINAYKAISQSGYTYDVETSVDFPGEFAIGSHVQGRTMRQILPSGVFFWNRIELDSDYKNEDLYNDMGIIDYERYRVKYANTDVYDVTDGIISNDYSKIEGYNNSSIDEFYFLVPATFFSANNFSVIQEETERTTTSYSMGLSKDGGLALMRFLDSSIRLDVNAENEIDIFDIISGLEITKCEFDIPITNGLFESMSIEISGAYNANFYDGTSFGGPAQFSLSLTLEVNNQGSNYTSPSKNNEVDLSNS